MPHYFYEAVDISGKKLKGSMQAENEATLESTLTATGAWVLHARLGKTPANLSSTAPMPKSSFFDPKVKRRDLIDFCTLMSFQTRAGVPMVQGLNVAAQDCNHPTLRRVLLTLQRHIESGLLFHEALEKCPEIFPEHFTKILRAGENSGKLTEAFDDLRKDLAWTEQILADVRQATMYPIIVISVVMCFVIGLFTFVIPKFALLLAQVKVPLPLLTQVVFGLSRAIKSTWWLWLIIIPTVVIALVIAKRVSKRVAVFVDHMRLRMPVFGPINLMLSVSRFAHNLAMLYRSGIPIVQALDLCQGLVGSPVVEQAVLGVSESVKTGSTIAEAIRKQPVFPPLLLRMVMMGETTGNLDAALQNVSDYYNDIIPRRIKALLTMLEPMLTVSMIVLVGLVALSIYLPILALMGSIH